MRRTRQASVLLLLSGAAALICETLWAKQLSRVVGVEIHAVTIALSGFFAGLAIGGVVFGRMADRSTRPLRVYASLEAGAAVLGVAATMVLARVPPLYVALQDSIGVLAWILPCALVAAPAFLIGGTLPDLGAGLARHVRDDGESHRPKEDRSGQSRAEPRHARIVALRR